MVVERLNPATAHIGEASNSLSTTERTVMTASLLGR
jgi:hypothetical protein